MSAVVQSGPILPTTYFAWNSHKPFKEMPSDSGGEALIAGAEELYIHTYIHTYKITDWK
jgi:hypothetical protein